MPTLNQYLSNVLVHVVFSTHRRNPCLGPMVCEDLYPYMERTLEQIFCPAIQIGGRAEHVHILCQLDRTITIAEMVDEVKTASAKLMKLVSPEFSWQLGYGAFSVSATDAAGIAQYILDQETLHMSKSFEQEYKELLAMAGIEYDPSVWA